MMTHRCKFCSRLLRENQKEFCSPLCYQSDIQMKLAVLKEQIGISTQQTPSRSPGVAGSYKLPPYRGPLPLRVHYTDTQFSITLKINTGYGITINWGDGTSTFVAGQGSTLISKTSNYTKQGYYSLYIVGDYTEITLLGLAEQDFVTGNIAGFSQLTKLTFFVMSPGMYGDIESLRNLPALTAVNFVNCSGVYGDFSTLPSTITSISVRNTPVTFNRIVDLTSVIQINITQMTSLTPVMIDNIIKSYKDATNGRLSIYSGNNVRTSDSDDALRTMLSNGTVVFLDNDGIDIGTFGSELHTDANAISDPNGNETNALTGWTATGLGSPNVFEVASGSGEFYSGSYSFKVDANSTPTSNAAIYKSFTVTSDSYYISTFNIKHIGTGGNWQLLFENSAVGYVWDLDTEWKSFKYYRVAPDTSFEFRFKEINTTNNGGIYIDNFSLRELTLP